MLKTNLDKGIIGDDADLSRRRNAFGANTYPQKKGRSFWVFLWETWQDTTLIIRMIAAAISLVLGIKTEFLAEGTVKSPHNKMDGDENMLHSLNLKESMFTTEDPILHDNGLNHEDLQSAQETHSVNSGLSGKKKEKWNKLFSLVKIVSGK